MGDSLLRREVIQDFVTDFHSVDHMFFLSLHTFYFHVMETRFIILYILQGLMMEIYGPTLIDLRARTNSTYEALATAVASKNIGYFTGAILGGILVDKYGLFCDLMLALSLDATAFATIGIPWVSRTELIWVLCFIKGVGGGVLNTCKFVGIESQIFKVGDS